MKIRGVVGWRAASVVVAVGALTAGCSSPGTTTASAKALASDVHVTTITASKAYTPKAPTGGTDDYHCTLIDPKVTADEMIVASQFLPGSPEVHHAILFLIPPQLASQAQALDNGGTGWTCFGETVLPHTSLNLPFGKTSVDGHISGTPWLSGWAPGQKLVDTPTGTGELFPAGSLVVAQIHYNLLVGDQPVTPKIQLDTVPAAGSTLQPLHLTLAPAPPDIPCPATVSGPLCDRTAELASLASRTGQSQADFVGTLEEICGRDPQNPPAGATTSCIWPLRSSGYIVRVVAHMHLLGVGMKIVLNPGTPGAKTLLDMSNYDFNNQRFYDISPPAPFAAGDKVQVTCTYNAKLGQELPLLRGVAPHFVTWGDGSSDEMCLGIVESVTNLPAP